MSEIIPIDAVPFFDVITSNPTVAGTPVSDADVAPTFDVYKENTDTGLLGAQTMVKRTGLTGNYRGTFTASAANGFVAGKWFSIIVSATVSAVAGKCVAKNFRCGPAEAQAGVPKVDVQYVVGAAPPTVADTSAGVWDLTRAGHSTAGTFGEGTASVQGNVTGSVASVTGNVTGNVVGTVAAVTGSVAGNVGGSVLGSVAGNVSGNVIGSVGSVVAAVAITSNIKKNQALANFTFTMTDSTTHALKTGLGSTVAVVRKIDGGAFAAGTLSAVTEISNGWYTVDFASGDLNGNVISFRASCAASDDTDLQIVTQP